MSHTALSWAWSIEGLTSTQKFLLVALADFADEENSCFPGQEKLANMIGVQRQTVSKNLADLEAQGLIGRSRRSRADGSRTSDRFVLNIDQCPQNVRWFDKGPMSAKQGDMNHKRTTSNNPSIVSPSIKELFSLFWEEYPRKAGKATALKAFERAIKRTGDASVVIEGAKRLKSDPNLPEKQFIPHPSTWLNRDGWEDEALPVRSGSRVQERTQNNLAVVDYFSQQSEGREIS